MKEHRFLLIAVSLVMLFAILSGCTSPATPAAEETEPPAVEATEPPAAEQTEPPASEEPVTIQYWSNGWFSSAIEGRQALVDKFNAEHEGEIQVEYVQGDWAAGEQYMQNGIAAGGGIACIVEWWVGGAQDWYSKGYLNDLRPYMTPEIQAYMDEAQWKAREYAEDGAIVTNGTVLGQPILTLMYNPAYFEAAGIEPATSENPWTWDELFENAALLTLDANGNHLGEEGFDAENVVQWGLIERLDPEKVWEYGLVFAQNRMGQPVVRQEDGRWGWFLDEAAAADYEKFLTPIAAGITPEAAIGLSGDSQEQMLADGTAAMIMRETFAIPTIHEHFPDFEFDIMPIPFDEGQTWYYEAGGEGMVMPKTCEHPEEAAEFLFWVMKPENLATYAYGNYMAPANTEAMDQEPFVSDPTWDVIKNYLATGESFVSPFNPYWVEFRDTIASPILMDVASGVMTFEEANQLLSEQADEVLNQ